MTTLRFCCCCYVPPLSKKSVSYGTHSLTRRKHSTPIQHSFPLRVILAKNSAPFSALNSALAEVSGCPFIQTRNAPWPETPFPFLKATAGLRHPLLKRTPPHPTPGQDRSLPLAFPPLLSSPQSSHPSPSLQKLKFDNLVTQSCPTLCYPMDCSLPGSSVYGIF